jgi:exopolysaccharide production protein ExoY
MSSEAQDLAVARQSEIPRTSGGAASRQKGTISQAAIPAIASRAIPSNSVGRTEAADQAVSSTACGHPQSAMPLGGSIKRAIDVVIAGTAIALLLPVMLIIMGLIKLALGGPIFFAHARIGYRGKPFRCYKFRTMVVDAEGVLDRHLAKDPLAAQEWRETRKLRNDPRVTFIGRMLRKLSLDELPQLINILRGEMSCVGPRPIVANELQLYGAHAAEYLEARPGLTGVWQVSGRNTLRYGERVALDSQYVRNWSLWNDMVILGKTFFAVLKFDETT